MGEASGTRRPGPVPYARGDRSNRAAIVAIVLAVVFVVLAAQNSASVEVRLLAWDLHTPVYGLAFVSALFGAIVIQGATGLRRHRGQQRDREHRELLRLRGSRRSRQATSPVDRGRALP